MSEEEEEEEEVHNCKMQFAIYDQENDSLVCGTFITTQHWHVWPNMCSSF
jgi:hypothetical protein